MSITFVNTTLQIVQVVKQKHSFSIGSAKVRRNTKINKFAVLVINLFEGIHIKDNLKSSILPYFFK